MRKQVLLKEGRYSGKITRIKKFFFSHNPNPLWRVKIYTDKGYHLYAWVSGLQNQPCAFRQGDRVSFRVTVLSSKEDGGEEILKNSAGMLKLWRSRT